MNWVSDEHPPDNKRTLRYCQDANLSGVGYALIEPASETSILNLNTKRVHTGRCIEF